MQHLQNKYEKIFTLWLQLITISMTIILQQFVHYFCEKNGSDIDWLDFDCWIQKLTNILMGCLYHQHGLAACISHLEPRC